MNGVSNGLVLNEFNRAVHEAVQKYEGMKLPYGVICKQLSISEAALIKSLLYLIESGALHYPGGPHSRVFFTGSKPTNWRKVVERAILDAAVVAVKEVEGKPTMMQRLHSVLGPGPEWLRLREQLSKLKAAKEISEPIKGTFFVGEPPEDWLREALKPKEPREDVIYHEHDGLASHLKAKLHDPAVT